ncbi:MAG: hypothetical protein A2287_07430 [Candidatus Melainabacteria bacterium RIFOXYA12_FULL_32_12]|nr:MAG: hypothetical protein A2255_02805 [Candidatus Melainabacteria bacterium RIFOXYA2_FULL_32_9]OGI29263.1 MAG: hypothetical protein A2287_07430 [Candidatus Melainabacteria bacterium RIFOXYA12_FULL_32_12]
MRIKFIQNMLDLLRNKKRKNAKQMNNGFLASSNIYEKLKEDIKKIPFYNLKNIPSSQVEWLNNLNKLKKLMLTKNPNNFLQWGVIQYTMFITDEHGNYIPTELDYLKNRADWSDRYIHAIRENIVGNPEPCKGYPASSCNLIHHAYSVAQFEEKTQIKINEINTVFEFGGGYGSMSRLFYNLGFNGKYIIYDLPAFSILQKYYLKTLGFEVLSIEEFDKSNKGILCISDINELKSILIKLDNSQNNLFLGTWSISETPLSVRESIVPLLNNLNLFLIAYQNNFNEMDNIEYFNNFMVSRSDINWQTWHMEYLPGSNYLIGKNH